MFPPNTHEPIINEKTFEMAFYFEIFWQYIFDSQKITDKKFPAFVKNFTIQKPLNACFFVKLFAKNNFKQNWF
jgi:hypothetical protein